MKKLLLTALLVAGSFLLNAQTRVGVEYAPSASIPEVTHELMDFLDVKYMKINVHGDIKGKKWQFWEHEVNEGKVTSKPLLNYTFEFADTVATFTFMARSSGDTVRVSFKTPTFSSEKKYAIYTANGTAYPARYILLETFPAQPYTTQDQINLVAYSTGIRLDVDGAAYNYCKLRDARTPPAEWQAKYGVPRFVYFSLRLE